MAALQVIQEDYCVSLKFLFPEVDNSGFSIQPPHSPLHSAELYWSFLTLGCVPVWGYSSCHAGLEGVAIWMWSEGAGHRPAVTISAGGVNRAGVPVCVCVCACVFNSDVTPSAPTKIPVTSSLQLPLSPVSTPLHSSIFHLFICQTGRPHC